ncbi:MAG: histidine phosphatase family protein [Acidobacteria bacterium]|nr:MAG: histidine phosphatase family protein [Acidobacteriota bacterium]PYQ24491.1 MAG: histidine phosphatase family protein [Acidobacteriota bacterium]
MGGPPGEPGRGRRAGQRRLRAVSPRDGPAREHHRGPHRRRGADAAPVAGPGQGLSGGVAEAQKWPDVLWAVRHGESAANTARQAAEAAGLGVIELAMRDPDVPLSLIGHRQAAALGRWFGGLAASRRPTAVLVSPYLRARETAERLLAAAEMTRLSVVADERLREREFGVFDGLTKRGIEESFPDQAALRRRMGKFYFRPPGGESWCDVILRLRSVLATLTRDYRRERVLVVAHQVVVLCFRYLLERMSEEELLAIDRAADVANCSVTAFAFDRRQGRRGKLVLERYNFVAPLEEAGEPVTTRPDAPAAPE